FSSRRRHTRLQGDWSSDVCSSDLEMVVIHADTAMNRSLGIWRIGNCNARGKIQFIHRPVGPASSALAGRSKREFRLISQPLSSRNGSIDEPLVEVDCRSNLLPVHFI